MAYQQVKTPRFWVSTLQWLNSKGLVTERGDSHNARLTNENSEAVSRNIFNINPVNPNILKTTTDNLSSYYFGFNVNLKDTMRDENNFSMFLGHSFKSDTIRDVIIKDMNQTADIAFARQEYLNGSDNSDSDVTAYDGFSINIGNIEIDDNSGDNAEFELSTASPDTIAFWFETDSGQVLDEFKIGSILYGNYYTMPHSPDLNLTMTREYGGTKTIETKGGATLSNSYWKKQPDWCNRLPAWQLSDDVEPLAPLASSGRRIWNLSFSYLDQENLFPEDLSLRNTNVNPIEQEFLSNNSNANFFSDVIHKTVGLPFVFQLDKDDTTNFAICMFDQDSFKFTQQAPNLYSCSMTIREVW